MSEAAVMAGSSLPGVGGAMSASFAAAFHGLLVEAGWQPETVPEAVRDRVFGTNGIRELMEPAYWALLQGVDGMPAVIADSDVNTAGLERHVAKYVWWIDSGRPAFWSQDSFLVSGLARTVEADAAVHNIIACSFGNELERGHPPLRVVLAEVDRRGTPTDWGLRLARVAYLELRRRVATATVQSPTFALHARSRGDTADTDAPLVLPSGAEDPPTG
jgi:hypothetical protein